MRTAEAAAGHDGTRGRTRRIGPIGTASRLTAGALVTALAFGRGRVTWWDAAAAAAFPLVATLVHRLVSARWTRHSDPAARRTAAGYIAALVAIAAAVALTYVTPADEPAVWLWLGISMLIAAARGDAGCEVLAIANLVTGRRDELGCIVFSPIDVAEGRSARPPDPRG
jgi:hypothetical protein